MSKNKFIRNIALFLIVVLTLPIVNAQTLAGSRIYYIVINALVIGIVLFILQAVLVPGKPDKERVSAWIIVVIASLVLAFLFGKDGFIWKSGIFVLFFNIKLIINSIVIAILLYFLAGFLLKDKVPKSTEGNTGYIILVFIISFVIAFNVAPDRFIWQQETLRALLSYLFSGEQYQGPGARPGLAKGLLHYRGGLIVGITGFLVISFFFKHWLIKEDSNKWLNYALAALFAYHLAAPPANALRDVVFMGELAFTLIVLNSMKTTFGGEGKKLIVSVVASMFIVGMASTLLTLHSPENRGFYGWVGCHFGFIFHCDEMPGVAGMPGVGSGAGGFSSSTLIIFAALLAAFLIWAYAGGESGKKYGGWGIGLTLLALILYWAFSAGGSASGKIFGSLGLIALVILGLFLVMFRGENRRRVLTLAWGEIKKRLNAIKGSATLKRDAPLGREHQFFRENRMLFHALANWTTRAEITYRYWDVVKNASKMWNKLKDQISQFIDREKLRKEIIIFRSGGVLNNGEIISGWNRLNLEVVELMNRFANTIATMQFSSEFRLKAEAEYTIDTQDITDIQTTAERLFEKIQSEYNHYKERLDAYGAHYALKAYKEIILHMSNVVGDIHQHPQRFARPDAEYDMGDQTGKPNKARKDAEGMPLDEVTQFGEVIEDITEQRDSFGDLPADPRLYKKPRKLKNPNDIIDYPRFVSHMDNIEKDWKGLAEDIRFGLHHPKSRTINAYLEALAKGKYYEWADLEIKQITPPSSSDWAIDMRGLADPGKNVYWGRKHFYSDTLPISSENIPPDNPLPIFSSLGLKKYLIEASIKDGQDRAKIIEFLMKYHADSGAPEKELPDAPVGIYLGEEAAKAEEK